MSQDRRLLLQCSIVQADQNSNSSTNLQTVISTRDIVAYNTDALWRERSPSVVMSEDLARLAKDRRINNMNPIRAVRQDSLGNVKDQRVGGILAVGRFPIRVGAKCEVEEVRKEKR